MHFVTMYYPAVENVYQILMEHWSLIQNWPLLKIIFTKPPIISNRKGISLYDMLVKAKVKFEGDNETPPKKQPLKIQSGWQL